MRQPTQHTYTYHAIMHAHMHVSVCVCVCLCVCVCVGTHTGERRSDAPLPQLISDFLCEFYGPLSLSLSLSLSLTHTHTHTGQRPQLPSDFLCEFMCGFYGPYGEVVKHETTCTMRGCSLSSRSLLRISISMYVHLFTWKFQNIFAFFFSCDHIGIFLKNIPM